MTAAANSPALFTIAAIVELKLPEVTFVPIGATSCADCIVIWSLMTPSVAPTIAIACTWFEVPVVNALVRERAVCNAASEIAEPATADRALPRSAEMRAATVDACKAAVPD